MCNCKNKKNVEPRLNAQFDRGSRNPDIRAPKIAALNEEQLAALRAQSLASMPSESVLDASSEGNSSITEST
jgi:hypothetical protein